MSALEIAILHAIAKQLPLMGKEALKTLGSPNQPAPTLAKVRAALERLRKAGLVSKHAGEKPQIEDPMLTQYLLAGGNLIL